jgi:hypothetical protein
MMNWLADFFVVLRAMITDVLPIMGILFGFQILVIRKKIPNLGKVLLGFCFVLVGLTLFLQGLEQSLFPLGKLMAEQLTNPEFIQPSGAEGEVIWRDYLWVYAFAAAIGFSTTIAEPSLIAVAIKAQQVSGGAMSINGLRISVAIGVAFGIALGTLRIVTGTPLEYYIIPGYVIVLTQTYFAPKMIIPLAFDSGGVTTSTVTVPLVTALGLGLASTVPGRSMVLDGFGLIAFASLCPIISVMGYVQLTTAFAHRHKQED